MAATTDDLCDLEAGTLAALIAARRVSPVAAVEASLARIAEVQPALNAFTLVLADEARAAAIEAEAAIRRGDPLGPLHGVPVAIKDFTPSAGHLTTRGSKVFAERIEDHDPVIVRRLEAAGAILVGKTTTPELAHSSFTESPLWGVTRNPWKPERSAGGSSGGAAVAVATGCVPLAEGTDMGGSVRIPAAACGVVGLKPSLGRIPMDILDTVFDPISHFGPLARTVADVALFLRATEGPDDADIQSQARPVPLPERLDGDVRGLRVALSVDLGLYAVEAEVAANLEACADALREAGAVVEPAPLAFRLEAVEAWATLWGVFLAAAAHDYFDARRDEMDPSVVALVEAGRRVDAVTYKRLEAVRTRQWRALAAVFRDHDALLCPTLARVAPPHGRRDGDFERVDAAGRLHGYDMTALFNNVAPCPALSVPSGLGAGGLPTGAQIVGRRYDDATVLRLGAAIERRRPWIQLRPTRVAATTSERV